MAALQILVLEGDGIGPEIVAATLRVLRALRLDIAFTHAEIGVAALLLSWLGDRRGEAALVRAAAAIEAALDRVLAMPDGRTADLGGTLGTDAFGARVAAQLPRKDDSP